MIFTYFQIRARISPLPVANNVPIGLGATDITNVIHCQFTVGYVLLNNPVQSFMREV